MSFRKELATSINLIQDLEFDKLPLDLSVLSDSEYLDNKKNLFIGEIVNNSIDLTDLSLDKNNTIISIYDIDDTDYEEDIRPLSLSVNRIIGFIEYAEHEIRATKVEVDKLHFNNGELFVFITAYFNDNDIRSYMLTYDVYDLLNDYHIFSYKLIQNYDSLESIQKITSVSCSKNSSVVSLILGNNYHIVLKFNIKNCILGGVTESAFEISLKNYSRYTNTEDKRTLYSVVNNEGNRIIVSDRDEQVKVRNNNTANNLGTVNSLVYDYKTDKWILENRFFEVNLNIRNIGKYLDVSPYGDKLLTSAVYNPINTEDNKEVIYLLSKGVKGKWGKFARGVIDGEITNLSIIKDSNEFLVETLVKVDEDKSIKKLHHLSRTKDEFINNLLTNDDGIFNQLDSLDPHEYISYFKLLNSIYDCLVLTKNTVTGKYHLFTLITHMYQNDVQVKLKE